MYVLRFIQVTKPVISSRIIRFQVEQTNNMIALAVFMFVLSILVEQTKSFYRFYRYPHCQKMTSFMVYTGTSNVANSQASC